MGIFHERSCHDSRVSPRVWLLVILALIVSAVPLAENAMAQSSADVEIELDIFGVGNVYRPGELTGVRLRLTSLPGGNLGEATSAWVQLEVADANGDIVECSRAVTLTRGRPTPVWLYVPLPPDVTTDTIYTARVFEFTDGQRRGELGGRRFRASDAIAPSESVPLGTGMLAVVGQRQMGLRAYADAFDQADRPLSAHERTRVAFGIRPDQLPDRWDALKGFEAVVWSSASPQQLSSDHATAVREYVRRGGHLILVLPEDINPWQFGVRGQTTLEDMLPQTEPRKDEAVPVRELLPVMSKARDTQADFTMGIRVFRELNGAFDNIDNYYEPLIALPDGRVVVVQRTFGHGRITVCGIDVASQRLAAVPLSHGGMGIPQADAFWNRIIGRRADTPTSGELDQIREADLLMRFAPSSTSLGSGSLISQQIAMTTQAGLGLLVALVLFGSYWLLAGPGGFGILKMYKQVRHAWVAFAAIAGVFTAVAWGTVSVLRIKEPQINHFTVLDHIARSGTDSRPGDPQQQRAVSWFELYVPGYASPRVTLDSESEQRNVLLPWIPPNDSLQRFPNVDRYAIDVGAEPNSYSIPARSTSTPMYAHWVGGIDPDWGGLVRSHPEDPVRAVIDGGGTERSLTGAITHDLPGTLRDVVIIWNRNLRLPPLRYHRSGDDELGWVPSLTSGQMLNAGFMWRMGSWERGAVIDMSAQDYTAQANLARAINDRYVETMRGIGGTTTRPVTADTRRRYLEMLSFFHQLTPPAYVKGHPDEEESTDRVTFNRHIARELDLSEWFNRPCIIVIGYLDNSELPMSIRVNDSDRPVASTGTTMVRWIYPLPIAEPIAFRPSPSRD